MGTFALETGELGLPLVRQLVIFEVGEDFGGSLEDGIRQAGEFGDVDAVALVCAAGDDFAGEGDLVILSVTRTL